MSISIKGYLACSGDHLISDDLRTKDVDWVFPPLRLQATSEVRNVRLMVFPRSYLQLIGLLLALDIFIFHSANSSTSDSYDSLRRANFHYGLGLITHFLCNIDHRDKHNKQTFHSLFTTTEIDRARANHLFACGQAAVKVAGNHTTSSFDRWASNFSVTNTAIAYTTAAWRIWRAPQACTRGMHSKARQGTQACFLLFGGQLNSKTTKYPNVYIILALHPCKVSIILIDCGKLESIK